MGCDIHSYTEVKRDGKWILADDTMSPEYAAMTDRPFGWRSYAVFGFLADVRNYSGVKPISGPRGLPNDSEWLNGKSEYDLYTDSTTTVKSDVYDNGNYHTYSWLTLAELLAFDYDQPMEDLRVGKWISKNVYDGAWAAEPGDGIKTTYRAFLMEGFFNEMNILKTLGDPENVRIIFWFDN